MKTDICLITEGLSAFEQTGGVGTWTKELIRSLSHYSFSWINFSSKNEASTSEFCYPNLQQTVSIPITRYPLDIDSMEKTIKGIDLPNAVLYHATSTGCASLLGMALSQRRKVSFILSEHAIYWKELAETHELECGIELSEDYGSYLRSIAKKAYQTAKVITSPVRYVREFQLEEGAEPGKSIIISNGLHPLPRLRKEQGFCLGFVGRITRIKNLELWIDIAWEICHINPNFRFKIIGPVEDHFYVNLLRKKISQIGMDSYISFLPTMGSLAWTREIDALLLTSLNESQPYVILEAFSAKIPVFARAVGGIPETVGNAGFLFSVEDKKENIAKAVNMILTDPQKKADLTKRALKLFYHRYHIRRMKKEFSRIYQKEIIQYA